MHPRLEWTLGQSQACLYTALSLYRISFWLKEYLISTYKKAKKNWEKSRQNVISKVQYTMKAIYFYNTIFDRDILWLSAIAVKITLL